MEINYLPIGSIVQVLKKDELFMIVGLAVENENHVRKDYVAVRYPMGVLNSESYFFINNSMIDKVIHKGYDSVDHEVYKKLLNKIISMEEVKL